MKEEQRWQAVITNDAAYDGAFFYAVDTTGIFCRPSCKSKRPKRDNVRFFTSALAAQQAGFRPCKRCRPDLLEYKPLDALAQKARATIDAGFAAPNMLVQQLGMLGASYQRIGEVFKQHYGTTLGEYAAQLRLNKAMALLEVGEGNP